MEFFLVKDLRALLNTLPPNKQIFVQSSKDPEVYIKPNSIKYWKELDIIILKQANEGD